MRIESFLLNRSMLPMTKIDNITIERWLFMLMIAVLGYMCSREINRLSTSIDNLTLAQQSQLNQYQELKSEVREFRAIYTLDKLRWDAK